jgi:hypothetical protein
MSSTLQSKPIINKDLGQWFSGATAGLKDAAGALAAKASSDGMGWGIVAGLIVFAIGLFVWYFRARHVYETPANIGRIVRADTLASAAYDNAAQGRTGIRAYLQQLKAAGVPDNHLCLTNFYVSTVNAAGMYFPTVDGVATPMAIRAAVDGGARAFVFDLWPDLTPGAQYAPVVQIVESGSLWRRVSLNAIPFVTMLKTLVQQCYEITPNPGKEDPIILYLRFRGKPRQQTFTAAAAALQSTIEPYRLANAYNNCRSQDSLFSTPITSLFKKVIVMSNLRAQGNMLSDYINVGPKDGIKMEWTINEAKGLTVDGKADAVRKIQQNLAVVAPLSEDAAASDNKYDFQQSLDIGIQMVAMNFWNNNDKLKAYMDPKLFGKASYAIKPVPIRYIIETLPAPKYPENPNWGTGATAGTPTTPPAIRLP